MLDKDKELGRLIATRMDALIVEATVRNGRPPSGYLRKKFKLQVMEQYRPIYGPAVEALEAYYKYISARGWSQGNPLRENVPAHLQRGFDLHYAISSWSAGLSRMRRNAGSTITTHQPRTKERKVMAASNGVVVEEITIGTYEKPTRTVEEMDNIELAIERCAREWGGIPATKLLASLFGINTDAIESILHKMERDYEFLPFEWWTTCIPKPKPTVHLNNIVEVIRKMSPQDIQALADLLETDSKV